MSATKPIAEEVEQAIAPLLARDGFELVLIEYVPRQRVLRLFIDHSRGVTLDDCVHMSRVIGDLLDAEGISDHISGRYHLEVSSPGLDRPLVKPQDFQKYVGRDVNLTTHELVEGRRKFSGKLVEASLAGLQIVVDGKTYAITYSEVAKARLVPDL